MKPYCSSESRIDWYTDDPFNWPSSKIIACFLPSWLQWHVSLVRTFLCKNCQKLVHCPNNTQMNKKIKEPFIYCALSILFIFGNVYPWFQSRGVSITCMLHCLCAMDSSDSPLVDTCWPLSGQHCSRASLVHYKFVYKQVWSDLNTGPSVRHILCSNRPSHESEKTKILNYFKQHEQMSSVSDSYFSRIAILKYDNILHVARFNWANKFPLLLTPHSDSNLDSIVRMSPHPLLRDGSGRNMTIFHKNLSWFTLKISRRIARNK